MEEHFEAREAEEEEGEGGEGEEDAAEVECDLRAEEAGGSGRSPLPGRLSGARTSHRLSTCPIMKGWMDQ